MNSFQWPGYEYWPHWQRILFRFLFVYFILQIAPWGWIAEIPGISYITGYYYQLVDHVVQFANKNIFKAYKELVQPNGSGDTSWAYTQMWLYLIIAGLSCVVWTLIDRKNENYNRIAYWFRLVLRYFLIINCFRYGFAKVFLHQMPFPNTSQLATPLGDLLPMRLSWMFIGYSSTYQFFTGLMEVVAGILLLFRRTSTFGTFYAAGVFTNVFMMNIGYDIPVKLYSLHLLLSSLLLLAFEYRRIFNFFILNRSAERGNLYDVRLPKRWMRIAMIVLKLYVVVTIIILPLRQNLFPGEPTKLSYPIAPGVYNVEVFVKNGDTIPFSLTDTMRWRDVIFEINGSGSINAKDTSFRQLYGRSYFGSKADTAIKEITFTKRDWMFNMYEICKLKYAITDSNRVILRGKIHSDSVYAELLKTNRHFQLAERQFHWLSEYNR